MKNLSKRSGKNKISSRLSRLPGIRTYEIDFFKADSELIKDKKYIRDYCFDLCKKIDPRFSKFRKIKLQSVYDKDLAYLDSRWRVQVSFGKGDFTGYFNCKDNVVHITINTFSTLSLKEVLSISETYLKTNSWIYNCIERDTLI